MWTIESESSSCDRRRAELLIGPTVVLSAIFGWRIRGELRYVKADVADFRNGNSGPTAEAGTGFRLSFRSNGPCSAWPLNRLDFGRTASIGVHGNAKAAAIF
jgi:hypothetical protein